MSLRAQGKSGSGEDDVVLVKGVLHTGGCWQVHPFVLYFGRWAKHSGVIDAKAPSIGIISIL